MAFRNFPYETIVAVFCKDLKCLRDLRNRMQQRSAAMLEFSLLSDLRDRNVLQAGVFCVKQIKCVSATFPDDSVVFSVVDKSVSEPVTCHLSFQKGRFLYGAITVGMPIYMQNFAVISTTSGFQLSGNMGVQCTEVIGFTPHTEGLDVSFSGRFLLPNMRFVGEQVEIKVKGVRKLAARRSLISDVEVKALFCVEVLDSVKWGEMLLDVYGPNVDKPNALDCVHGSSTQLVFEDQENVEGVNNVTCQQNELETQCPVDFFMDNTNLDAYSEQPTMNFGSNTFLPPKAPYRARWPLTPLKNTVPYRYYNIACKVMAILQTNKGNCIMRVCDGTKVNRPLFQYPAQPVEVFHYEVNSVLSQITYDVDLYDEHASMANAYKVDDFVVLVNVHTYVNKKGNEALIMHSGTKFERGIYDLKQDSAVGVALAGCLARTECELQAIADSQVQDSLVQVQSSAEASGFRLREQEMEE